MCLLNRVLVFYWRLPSTFIVKAETFQVNQVEDFMKKKKKTGNNILKD